MKWTSKITVLYQLGLFILAGLVTGSISGFTMALEDESVGKSIIYAFVNLKATGNFFELMYYGFLPTFLILVFCFFNGFSVLGGFLRWFCAFCWGTAIGFIATMLFKVYTNGFSYASIIFLPFSILFSLIVTLSLREAHKLSKNCYNILFGENLPENKERLFKEYLVKLLLLLAAGLIISAIDAVINCLFFDFFKLYIE
ncbi:MAG: hypothetical protein J6K88_00155 [Oscillospiraceae bacterium]|nr:hypothetical protein [Oscillospiraceae bacterium]